MQKQKQTNGHKFNIQFPQLSRLAKNLNANRMCTSIIEIFNGERTRDSIEKGSVFTDYFKVVVAEILPDISWSGTQHKLVPLFRHSLSI